MTVHEAGGRLQGVVADWNDDRGFGFIRPDLGGPRVFAHVSAFPHGRRPVTGSAVTYAGVRDERNRMRASDVRYAPGAATRRASGPGVLRAAAGTASFLALLVVLVLLDRLPLTLLAAVGVLSVVAFAVYGADKAAAREGRWRTSETTLHAIAVLGGWPGALVARPVFRHKTTKQPFRTVFWCTVLVHCLALGWFVHAAPVALP